MSPPARNVTAVQTTEPKAAVTDAGDGPAPTFGTNTHLAVTAVQPVPPSSSPAFSSGDIRLPPVALTDFELHGELGRGGMGVVYRAFDRRANRMVALKQLPRLDPDLLYRFKREFRTLTDVAHPNLVTIHELVSDGSQWFFTMELVDGVNFRDFVAEPPLRRGFGELTSSDPTTTGFPPARAGRLRRALRQLAEGVAALHASGQLHRDLKPNNVMVAADGRVVILDFGLAARFDDTGRYEDSERQILGTVAYMSPEQAAGEPLSAASDWYSVGVMLYEALTGRKPYEGHPLEILSDRQSFDPPAPSTIAPFLPGDLEQLCVDLMRRKPDDRPTGAEVLRRLAPDGLTPLDLSAPPSAERLLLGRDPHLQSLGESFAAVTAGQPRVVLMPGRSGAGKSTLLRHFLDSLRERAVVLSGRCYERESLPFKAIDSLVDALVRYLKRLPLADSRALMPRDVPLLARMFPVLDQIEAVATAPRRSLAVPEIQIVRRRAFVALRELLARLGDREPLVLAIDDLQWGDVDSAAALCELLRPPDTPPLLLVLCYRGEDQDDSPCLATLLPELRRILPEQLLLALPVDALSAAHARDLAARLLENAEPSAVETVARESGGNPFFLHEMARHLAAGGDSRAASAGVVQLDDVVHARVRALPADARRLLEAIAVSGRPLPRETAARATGIDAEGAALGILRTARLVRVTGGGHAGALETYHDRIRETIVQRLPGDQLTDYHRRLAEAMSDSGPADPEVVGAHWQGAGAPERAGAYFERAAELAARALAFDRAARLYQLALDARELPPPEERRLLTLLAAALANAGRGAAAAAAYLRAARLADPDAAIELRRSAALQLLTSGHVDEGLVELQAVLASVALQLPRSPRSALASLLVSRFLLSFRRLAPDGRSHDPVPPHVLRRIDVCWSAVMGTLNIDPIRGAAFLTRGLVFALRAGEPTRVCRALALEASYAATTGRTGRGRAERLARHAQAWADRIDDPHSRGMMLLGRGAAAYFYGSWQESLALCDQAARHFQTHCAGAVWEMETSQAYALWSMIPLGEILEIRRRRPLLVREARERGNLYTLTNLSNYLMSVDRLCAGDPDGTQAELDEVMSRWTQSGYHEQHHNALLAQMMIHLYRRDGTAARSFIERRWPEYARSLLVRVQQLRIYMASMRARAALAAAADANDRSATLRLAEKVARSLRRERVGLADAVEALIRAGIAGVRGDSDTAVRCLREAIAGMEPIHMTFYAAAARRRLGRLVGGDEGRELVRTADGWFAGQRIVNPAAVADMIVPGFAD